MTNLDTATYPLPWAGQPYSIKRHGITLTNCDTEPVQTPGCVQAHGALLVLRLSDLTVLQASENTGAVLGHPVESLLGCHVAVVVGDDGEARLRDVLAREPTDRNPLFAFTRPTRGGSPALDVTVHTVDGVAVVEFEVADRTVAEPDYYPLVKKSIVRLRAADSLRRFCDIAAEEVRALTGFDRVMVYKFHADGHGEVFAESRRMFLVSWLGMHYPVEDFPKPARDVFQKIWVRSTPDIEGGLAELVPLVNPDTGKPLEMTHCALRGASIMYTEYLKNIHVAAGLTMPIRRGGELWGLLACHHYYGPKHVPYRVRAACEFLAQVVSLQHTAAEDREHSGYRLRIESVHEQIVAHAARDESLAPLTDGTPTLIDGIDADGAALYHEGRWWRVGATPSDAELDTLDDWLAGRPEFDSATRPLYVTDSLVRDYPPAAGFAGVASGVLAVPLARGRRNRILWFRPEIIQTVNWAGNPHDKPLVIGPNGPRLTPRRSFELFAESVHKKSLPWLPVEVDAAAQFRLLIMDLVASRAARLVEQNAELTRSITDRVRAENRLKAQHAVASALADSTTLGEAATRILQSTCELNQWELGVLWHADEPSQVLRCLDLWHRPAADLARLAGTARERTFARGGGLPGRVWASGRPDCVRDPGEPGVAPDGPRSAFAAPIRFGPDVLGVMEFYGRSECAPDEELLRLFDAIGSQIGQFVRRKRTEQELLASHQENNRLLSAISSILISLDRGNRVTHWNDAAEAVFGLAERAVLGKRIEECALRWCSEEDRERFLRCYTESQNKAQELRVVTAGGQERILSLTNYPILEQNERLGCLVLGVDVTERKVLEEELRRAHKLESIGQLAAGIAHEINTPIQYIGDNTNFIADAVRELSGVLAAYRGAAGDPAALEAAEATAVEADIEYLLEEAPRALEQTREGVKHVSRIVKAMKEFAHPGTVDKSPIDLNKALETVVTVARNEWKYVAEVVTHLDPNLPPIRGLPGELNQVFLNLLVNAAHAVTPKADAPTDTKGAITITTRNLGSVAEVRIADSGCGIPEAIRGKIFDPFFTTKPVGQGTGQGLAIAHAVVVKQHGGALSFESEMGEGTTFIVHLPIDGHRITPSERLSVANTVRVPALVGGEV